MTVLTADAGRSAGQGDFAAAIAKALGWLVPFLILRDTMAFLNRSNVDFAEQAVRNDQVISNAAFGAELFFVGDDLPEIPPNLIWHPIGASPRLCRIIATPGFVAAASLYALVVSAVLASVVVASLHRRGSTPT